MYPKNVIKMQIQLSINESLKRHIGIIYFNFKHITNVIFKIGDFKSMDLYDTNLWIILDPWISL